MGACQLGIRDRGYSREYSTFQQLEGRAATRRDVTNLLPNASLFNGRNRVAASDDGERRGAGDALGNAHRAGRKWRFLEDSHWAIPE